MTTTEARDAITAALKENGFSLEYTFVPFSRSRNANNKVKNLNFEVTLSKLGTKILTVDYTMWQGYCPSFRLDRKDKNKHRERELISAECEYGVECVVFFNSIKKTAKKILPTDMDVLYSLLTDADVLSYASFEDWAGEYGFDPDSRKAHAIYTQCIEIALKLKAAFSPAFMDSLKTLLTDY